MKKLLVIALLIISMGVQAQNYKFWALSFKMINQYERWDEKSWEIMDNPFIVSITLDEDALSGGVKIYSKYTQSYDLIHLVPTPDLQDRTLIRWQAEDEEGTQCIVTLINYVSDDIYDAILIAYSDYAWMYSIKPK